MSEHQSSENREHQYSGDYQAGHFVEESEESLETYNSQCPPDRRYAPRVQISEHHGRGNKEQYLPQPSQACHGSYDCRCFHVSGHYFVLHNVIPVWGQYRGTPVSAVKATGKNTGAQRG